jgi:hypothetical protein
LKVASELFHVNAENLVTGYGLRHQVVALGLGRDAPDDYIGVQVSWLGGGSIEKATSTSTSSAAANKN